jgi:hypothetical protein
MIPLILAAQLLVSPPAETQPAGYEIIRRIPAVEATQAAAADERSFYAISSTAVAEYDRHTGKRLRVVTAEGTQHLNSGFFWEGKLYCAHSHYPKQPDRSDIRVFDPQTGKLTIFHTFERSPGSLVWCVRRKQSWWCCFAHYGADNAKTVLVEYHGEFQEQRRWTFPNEVVSEWDGMSASGGIWLEDTLLTSHHHDRVLYRLRLPQRGSVLELVERRPGPFPGQGLAIDPVTGGLIGIDRAKREIVLARLCDLRK